MRYGIAVVAAVALCGIVALAAGPGEKAGEKLVFKNAGFTIAPLDEPAKGTRQALMMFLAPSEQFSANVNVQIQEFPGTIEDYAAASKKQMEALKFKMIAEKVEKGVAMWEYSGTMQEKAMHWYAKAVAKPGTIYLVTATALEQQWQGVGGKLKACVDSFETVEAKAQP